jgi:hypothetical protein
VLQAKIFVCPGLIARMSARDTDFTFAVSIQMLN